MSEVLIDGHFPLWEVGGSRVVCRDCDVVLDVPEQLGLMIQAQRIQTILAMKGAPE